MLCNKEVILAAGAIISPALLQVSGIGPAAVLKDLNVTVRINLPGVGQNFQDHAMVGAFYNCEPFLSVSSVLHPDTDEHADTKPGLFSARNLTGVTLEEAKQAYFTNRTGKEFPNPASMSL